MSSIPNLDRYWGVVLKSLSLDSAEMSVSLSLYWTDGLTPHSSKLKFHGVRKFALTTGRVYHSEIVELISLEAHRKDGLIEICGEFSNYEFEIACDEISESEQV